MTSGVPSCPRRPTGGLPTGAEFNSGGSDDDDDDDHEDDDHEDDDDDDDDGNL